MQRSLKRVGAVLGGVALAVFVGGWLGNLWLESSGGRQLLQRELSRAMGSPVRLAGDYRFRLFPRILIVGTNLAIGPDEDDRAVRVASFRAEVALLPLLREELRIGAIELSGGEIDLARAARLGGAGGGQTAETVSLPSVAVLELTDFRLFVPDHPARLQLDLLRLSGFRTGRPAPVEIDAELFRRDERIMAVALKGSLTVEPALAALAVVLKPLALRLGSAEAIEIGGTLHWALENGAIVADLSHSAPGYRISLQIEVHRLQAISGRASLRFEAIDPPRVATAGIGFADRAEFFELEPVTVELDGQVLAGNGCLLLDETPLISLSLAADQLDLDSLSAWVPEEAGGAAPELPIEPAIEVTVAEARLAGASARGVRLLVGAERSCPVVAP